jgi:hypothetical protein
VPGSSIDFEQRKETQSWHFVQYRSVDPESATDAFVATNENQSPPAISGNFFPHLDPMHQFSKAMVSHNSLRPGAMNLSDLDQFPLPRTTAK